VDLIATKATRQNKFACYLTVVGVTERSIFRRGGCGKGEKVGAENLRNSRTTNLDGAAAKFCVGQKISAQECLTRFQFKKTLESLRRTRQQRYLKDGIIRAGSVFAYVEEKSTVNTYKSRSPLFGAEIKIAVIGKDDKSPGWAATPDHWQTCWAETNESPLEVDFGIHRHAQSLLQSIAPEQ
jgi:hypothetical protein